MSLAVVNLVFLHQCQLGFSSPGEKNGNLSIRWLIVSIFSILLLFFFYERSKYKSTITFCINRKTILSYDAPVLACCNNAIVRFLIGD
jgi:hypothetical protein